MKHVWWVLVLLACGPSTSPEAETWTSREFLSQAKTDKSFGGLPTRRLGVNSGDVIPWREVPFETQDSVQVSSERGLPVWPAFAEGHTASMLITEIWQDHPTPWVQPVYQFRSTGAARSDRGIFAVGVDSTFYTPYWRAEWVMVTDELATDALTSVTDVLNSKLPVSKGAMVVCPIVPSDVFLASTDGKTVVRPLTGEPVTALKHAEAWVDGTAVTYLGIGIDRQTVTDKELPIETPIYFFVRSDGQTYSLPPVLPDEPTRHSLHRRYNVTLPGTFGVFVPSARPELRQFLEAEGAPVPPADPLIAEATARPYLLRVASNPSCFAKAADFPASCHWLDSQSALEATVGQDVRFRTEVLITASTLQVGGM